MFPAVWNKSNQCQPGSQPTSGWGPGGSRVPPIIHGRCHRYDGPIVPPAGPCPVLGAKLWVGRVVLWRKEGGLHRCSPPHTPCTGNPRPGGVGPGAAELGAIAPDFICSILV